jgi:hypothetical protein
VSFSAAFRAALPHRRGGEDHRVTSAGGIAHVRNSDEAALRIRCTTGADLSSSERCYPPPMKTAARNRLLLAAIERARQLASMFRAGHHVFSVRFRQRV